jgi:hypothetical protein
VRKLIFPVNNSQNFCEKKGNSATETFIKFQFYSNCKRGGKLWGKRGGNQGQTSDRERGDILEQILNKGDIIPGSLLKGPSGRFRLA